jgi:hypothetical protein
LYTYSYTKPVKTTESNTKKDEHNTKQIKYRWKLNLILPHLHGGELTTQVEGGEEGVLHRAIRMPGTPVSF